MPRSFKDRLAELERLEAAAAPSPVVLDVAALTEADLLAAVFDGLRARTLIPSSWWLCGIDPYWRAVADRAGDMYEERGCWVCPIAPDEAQLVAAALRDGRLMLRDWPGRQPPISNSYQILPPVPYPAGHWESPLHQAVTFVQRGLYVWSEMWRDEPSAPPLPATNAAVVAWLERWCGVVV